MLTEISTVLVGEYSDSCVFNLLQILLKGRSLVSEKRKDTIIVAAHNDGIGAVTTMFRMMKGLVDALQKAEVEDQFRFVFINNGGWGPGYKFLLKEWKQIFPNQADTDKPAEVEKLLKKTEAVWFHPEEESYWLKFEKTRRGALDAPATRKRLANIWGALENWNACLGYIDRERVALTIEMGVPFLSAWSAKPSQVVRASPIPSVALTDMFWSQILHGSLNGAGEFVGLTEDIVYWLAEKERMVDEVFLFPLLSPRNYQDYLSRIAVKYFVLPGLFGARPEPDQVKLCTKYLRGKRKGDLQLGECKIIALSAGKTPVWQDIYGRIADALEAAHADDKHKDIALIYPNPTGGGMVIRTPNSPDPQKIQNPSSDRLALFGACDLGVTRGGVTTSEFVASRLPCAVVQEPNHSLSLAQQQAASEAGLCFTASLSAFDKGEEGLQVIAEWARDEEAGAAMRRRCDLFEFGKEKRFGEYIYDQYLR
jgi:hypothetical protein